MITDSLSELLMSRLCHDLAGPAGALSNGLELLEEGGAVEPDILEFMNSSAERMLAAIKYFRLTFGRSGLEEINPAEMEDIASEYCRSHGVRHIISPLPPNGIAWPIARLYLIFTAALINHTARDGKISGKIETGTNTYTISFSLESLNPQATQNLEAFRSIAGNPDMSQASSRDVFTYIAVQTLHEAKGDLEVYDEEGQPNLLLTIPRVA